MKKILTIALAALICAALFAACEQSESESQQESAAESNGEISESDLALPELPVPMGSRVFKSLNGKYGLLDKEANIIVEPNYKFAQPYETCVLFSYTGEDGNNRTIMMGYDGLQLGKEYELIKFAVSNDTGTYFAAAVTDGTRQKRVITKERKIYTEEEPNREYYILNSAGEPILDISFDAFNFLEPDMPDNPEGFRIFAERDGDYYQYVWSNGNYELEFAEHKGETGEKLFSYKKTCYHWYPSQNFKGYGLNDADGNVIFEPIYNGIAVPFEDRVILSYSSYGDAVEGEGLCDLVGIDGKVYANWNFIHYTFFEDGSWLGIAESNGEYFRESAADPTILKCFDENGNVRPRGYWFVDKDGKILSERFLSLDFRDEGEEYYKSAPESPDDIATAVTVNGETVRISVEEYICEP